MPRLSARLKVLDGRWEECGVDRFPGVVPESVNVSSSPWGFDTCSFQLRRDPELPQPDLSGLTPCEIDEDGEPIFRGRVQETPTDHQAGVINVAGRGDHYDLDMDVVDRSWVHSRLNDWQDARSKLTCNLAKYLVGGQVSNDKGAITLSFPKGMQVTGTDNRVGVILDLGPSPDAKHISIEWASSNNSPGTSFLARGSDLEDSSVSPVDDAFSFTLGSGASGTTSGSFATNNRYVHLFIFYTGAASTYGADVWIKLKRITVYRQAAYAGSSNTADQSILHASDVLRDLPAFAPDLSQDAGEIVATDFDIPDFAPLVPRTLKEIAEAANAFHRYRLKVTPERRLLFAPQLVVPKYKVGSWGGRSFQDASMGSAEDVYNHVIATAIGQHGEPVRVERWAAQQPGVAVEPVSSPSFPNPSFAADATGWSALGPSTIVRDTAVFDTTPASGKWTTPNAQQARLATTLTGTFKRGTVYVVTFRWRADVNNEAAARGIPVSLGHGGEWGVDRSWETFAPAPPLTWQTETVAWMPQADRTSGVELIFKGPPDASAQVWVDTFSLGVARPTVYDKRGLVKTKVLESQASMAVPALTQICDVFLQTHMKTPLKGSLTLKPGDVRDYRTDREVHPRELVKDTGELIHFSHLVDPDTGALGRDGQIAAVGSYEPAEEVAQVPIDSTRDNLESLLARYAVVSGGGG